MKVNKYPQRSEGWHRARLGLPTASNASKIIAPTGKRSTQARKFLHQLAWERVAGVPGAEDISAIPHIRDGLEREDAAADAFAEAFGFTLQEVGLCTTDDGKFGASPDRLIIGKDEIVEIKCPKPTTQIGYLLDGAEDAYKAQIAGHFLVGEWDNVHFWSYHPDAPAYHAVFDYQSFAPFVRLLRDYVAEFTAALDEAERKLRAMDWTWTNVLSNWPEDQEDEAW